MNAIPMFELEKSLQNLQEVIYAVDMQNYTVIFITTACEKVYGYTSSEFIKNPNLWFDVIVDEDKQNIFDNDIILRRGENLIQSYRITHKNGEIRWLESRIEPTLDSDGTLVRIDGITLDITHRKITEIALKNSESKFRTLIENSLDGIAVSDANRRIVFASESLTRITGYSVEEIQQMEIALAFHPDDRARLLPLREVLLSNVNNTINFTVRFLRKDGNWIWIEGITRNLLHDPVINGLVTNYRDITERVKYEEALKLSNQHLKKTNSELDRFVYSVSHDLRAPLASVLGAIEYSESSTTDAEILSNLSMMKNSIQKLDGFIVDILDYSRNNRTEVKREEIDFKELLEEVTSNLKFMNGAKDNVDISMSIENGMKFYSDRNRIFVITNNLVSNALRYTNPKVDKPFVQITVTFSNNDANLFISDNGMGIDEKYHEKIFDMFFRISRKSTGSGLGLYLVKETVEKLGGSIRLTSEIGKGSTFEITLPNLL